MSKSCIVLCVPGRLRISTHVPGKENVSLANTTRPLGINENADWFNNPDHVKQNIVLLIRGVKSGYYVCMNRKGKVYGAVSISLSLSCACARSLPPSSFSSSSSSSYISFV